MHQSVIRFRPEARGCRTPCAHTRNVLATMLCQVLARSLALAHRASGPSELRGWGQRLLRGEPLFFFPDALGKPQVMPGSSSCRSSSRRRGSNKSSGCNRKGTKLAFHVALQLPRDKPEGHANCSRGRGSRAAWQQPEGHAASSNKQMIGILQ